VLAIAPYLGGIRYDNRGNFPEQIHSIFTATATIREPCPRPPWTHPLFVIAASLVLHARDAIGERLSLFALFSSRMEPISSLLAVATHDAAATAGVAVALLASLVGFGSRD